jgi:hypothetical protein
MSCSLEQWGVILVQAVFNEWLPKLRTTHRMKTVRAISMLVAHLLVPVRVFSADQPAITVTNWQRYDFGGLSFRVPPGMINVPVQGIDSLVGQWDSTNISLHLDFGQFARVVFPPGTGTPVQVSGHAGQMGTRIRTVSPNSARPQPQVANFTNIGEVGVPDGPNGQFQRITFYYREPNDLRVVRAILDSVRY